jgi:hypothetical protein
LAATSEAFQAVIAERLPRLALRLIRAQSELVVQSRMTPSSAVAVNQHGPELEEFICVGHRDVVLVGVCWRSASPPIHELSYIQLPVYPRRSGIRLMSYRSKTSR